MFDLLKRSAEWNGQTIELETGKIARKASAAVTVRMGGSVVLCAVPLNKKLKEGIDFFPLSVHFLEKYYAVGRFPGGFVKREGKLSEREVLVSRLIDRSVRPLFPKDFFYEVNIVCTVLSCDKRSPTEVLAIIGSAVALNISEVPFNNLVAAVRVGIIDDELIFNIHSSELEASLLELVLAGTNNAIVMIESSAKEINNARLLSAIESSSSNLRPIIKLMDDFSKIARKDKFVYDITSIIDTLESLRTALQVDLKIAYRLTDSNARDKRLATLYENTLKKFSAKDNVQINLFNLAYKNLKKEIMRNQIFDLNTRLDGRRLDQIRSISCEIGLLPEAHGSSLFTRGGTQSLSTVTLGNAQDAQLRDDITGVFSEKFMLHYNFLPYSVGEVGMLKAPSRREIGHGKLASKAIQPILPESKKFPYTIRIVSEITESDGSSSMATICASSLALMDAGVPIKKPVAGIAMGLLIKGDKYCVLSDIISEEDALGDMDFKVALTKDGITAMQMDTKIDYLTMDIVKKAVLQAEDNCHHILDKMSQSISEPKSSLSPLAPRIMSMKVNQNKIRDIIGSGGKNIKEICEKTNSKIDIEDDGNIMIFAANEQLLQDTQDIINNIITDPTVGKIYKATVTRIVQFGIFAKFLGKNEGLLHISEISDRNINNIYDLFVVGMNINVKCISMDYRGKIKLTIKDIAQEDDFVNRDVWQDLIKKNKSTKYQGNKQHDKRFVNKKKDGIKAGGQSIDIVQSNIQKVKNIDQQEKNEPIIVSAKKLVKRFFS